MISKSVAVHAIFVSAFLVIFATNAYSENGFCSNVTVAKAGASDSGPAVALTNTNTTSQCGNWVQGSTLWFKLDNTNNTANAMLAAALSAKASGQKITVVSKSGNTYASWGNLTAVYID